MIGTMSCMTTLNFQSQIMACITTWTSCRSFWTNPLSMQMHIFQLLFHHIYMWCHRLLFPFFNCYINFKCFITEYIFLVNSFQALFLYSIFFTKVDWLSVGKNIVKGIAKGIGDFAWILCGESYWSKSCGCDFWIIFILLNDEKRNVKRK